MFNFLICLIISIFIGYSFSIIIVEKSNEWPLKKVRIILQLLLRKIYWKLPRVLFCATCSSFYFALISDTIIFFVASSMGIFYFFWPISGVVCSAFSWTIIEFLNKETIVNVMTGETNEAIANISTPNNNDYEEAWQEVEENK